MVVESLNDVRLYDGTRRWKKIWIDKDECPTVSTQQLLVPEQGCTVELQDA